MTTRTRHLDPQVRRALQAAGAAAKRGLDDPVLAELVMIRASQINACAFCLDMHVAVAVEKNGESVERIALLGAWREADGLYSERERAALALTEAMTILTDEAVPDEVHAAAAGHFDDVRLAHLIGVITVINSWNRLMVARRIEPGGPAW
ncbi:carboxymuconolactone decarboxylase family protein [Streptomyces sp. NPDC088785]|uniref:carboxymuconolactone decarboxylase family protein n=1 Tax=Streptomyces sp. NPDC088785 TaxID=3365897 RepID=UPI003816CB19